LQAGVGQLAHGVLCFAAGVVQLADALRRDGVFALGRDQFRAVYLEQRLAATDRLVGGVDVKPLDIAFELGGHRCQTAFVDFDATTGADRLVEHLQLGWFDLDTHFLDFLGADFQATITATILLAFIDRDVVHAHLVFLRRRRSVGQAHRVAVIQKFLFWLFFRVDRGNGCRAIRLLLGKLITAGKTADGQGDGDKDE